MAALGTFLGAADVEEVVPTELLSTFVQNFEYTPPVAQGIAWMKQGKGSIQASFPRWGSSAAPAVPAGTKAETDVFTDIDYDTAESTITPGLIGFRVPLSDEARAGVLQGVEASMLVEFTTALLDRLDSDILSSITSATNTAGAVTRDYTISELQSDMATYKALHVPRPSMGTALVLHGNAMADLLPSIHNSAAPKLADGDAGLGPEQGFVGTVYRLRAYESDNCPTESTGHAGCITPIGMNASGLGLVMTEAPSVRVTRGDDAEVRAVTYLIFRLWAGTGLTNPRRLLEVLTQ